MGSIKASKIEKRLEKGNKQINEARAETESLMASLNDVQPILDLENTLEGGYIIFKQNVLNPHHKSTNICELEANRIRKWDQTDHII